MIFAYFFVDFTTYPLLKTVIKPGNCTKIVGTPELKTHKKYAKNYVSQKQKILRARNVMDITYTNGEVLIPSETRDLAHTNL